MLEVYNYILVQFNKLALPGSVVLTQIADNNEGSGDFNVSWVDNSLLEISYELEYEIDNSANWIALPTQSANTQSYNFTLSIFDTQLLKVRVKAVTTLDIADSDAVESNSLAVILAANEPSSVVISQISDVDPLIGLQLDWVDNSAIETGFTIEYNVDNVGWLEIPSSPVVANTIVATFNLTPLDGATIKARIKANDTTDSDWVESNEVVVNYTINDPTSVVLSLTSGLESTGQAIFDLTWVDNSGVEIEYLVYYRINAGAWAPYDMYPNDTQNVTLTIFCNDEDDIEAQVQATTTVGASNAVVSNLETAYLTPNAPTTIGAVQSADNGTGIDIDVTWVDNSFIETGYNIEYNINAAGWVTAAESPTAIDSQAQTIVVTCLGGDDIGIRVRTQGSTIDSDWVELVGVVTASIFSGLAAPSAILITQDANQNSFDVSWTSNSAGSEDGFEIQYEINNSGTWNAWGSVGTGVVSDPNNVVGIVFQPTLHNATVSTRVRATSIGGDSDWVETVSPATATFTAPAIPGTFNISESGLGIVSGSYGSVTNSTGFYITINPNFLGYEFYEQNPSGDTTITFFNPNALYELTNGDAIEMSVYATRYGANGGTRASNILILLNQEEIE